MRIDILTLFPRQIDDFLRYSIIDRARREGRVEIDCTDIRDFSPDLKHHKVDDAPFGGGPGMVLMPEPVFAAVEAVEARDARPATRILLTPQGRTLNQAMVRDLAARERLLIIAGHYEGYDERIRIGLHPLEISIGDYVLSGGEAAAVVLADAVIRLVPGVVGDRDSLAQESFSENLLEYPHYTRPREFRGLAVPEVLLSGDHAKIEAWRKEQGRERTQKRRPDLLENQNETR
jgi:tRNA (guanine37-N1)-methyltransferase